MANVKKKIEEISAAVQQQLLFEEEKAESAPIIESDPTASKMKSVEKETLESDTAMPGARPIVEEKATGRSAFQVAEAFKMIRTNLLFSLATTEKRVVVFSSAEPGAGKSTLSANLAITMAQTGARVVLLDADMRKPTQHRNFRVSRTVGLSKILGGLSTVKECIVKDVKPNVDLIPAGPTPPNPSELLGSARMQKLLEELQKKYDYVFVDMPPLCVVTDALVVAPHAAGVVLVVRHSQTLYEEFGEALEKVEASGANLLGVVMTDMKIETGNYGRYSRYGRYGRYSRYGRYGGRYYRQYDYEYKSNK